MQSVNASIVEKRVLSAFAKSLTPSRTRSTGLLSPVKAYADHLVRPYPTNAYIALSELNCVNMG